MKDFEERCQGCEYYTPCKCGVKPDGSDNIVCVCDLEKCPYVEEE